MTAPMFSEAELRTILSRGEGQFKDLSKLCMPKRVI